MASSVGTAYVDIQPRWGKTHLAKEIELRQTSDGFTLLVEGVEFPWFISESGVSTTSTVDGIPSVTLTLLAESLVTNAVTNAVGA